MPFFWPESKFPGQTRWGPQNPDRSGVLFEPESAILKTGAWVPTGLGCEAYQLTSSQLPTDSLGPFSSLDEV